MLHVRGCALQKLELLRRQITGRKTRAFRLQKQTEVIQIIKLLVRELRSGAVTYQVLLVHQPFPLQSTQSLAHRRLGNIDLTRDCVDQNTGAWRNLQRHQLMINLVIDTIDDAERAQT